MFKSISKLLSVTSSQFSSNGKGMIIKGPTKESDWWIHKPKNENYKIKAMYPIKQPKKMRIALVRSGCSNRPFFTIQVKWNIDETKVEGFEQIGSWDPMPNNCGEQLIGIDIKRLLYWLAKGAEPTKFVSEILGLGGILPIHPRSYLKAFRTRQKIYESEQKMNEVNADADAEAEEKEKEIEFDINNLFYGEKRLPIGFKKRGI
uniref:Small ribosomal subunit protein bS16m n=1 Tax=Lepeophtheirus salmonis TaxID=72036 RepID=D3PJD7_LEPSM|nr:Probable 28S ribosomal protein S16, mitochondrial [Lepeophtheirus salmonis]